MGTGRRVIVAATPNLTVKYAPARAPDGAQRLREIHPHMHPVILIRAILILVPGPRGALAHVVTLGGHARGGPGWPVVSWVGVGEARVEIRE